jgi:hypothetical protein
MSSHRPAETTYVCRTNRGTISGWTAHQKYKSTPCRDCTRAHDQYTRDLFNKFGVNGAERMGLPIFRDPAHQAFVEDYVWLIASGETHRETIGRRMGCNPIALEQRLYRLGITALHRMTREESPAVAA